MSYGFVLGMAILHMKSVHAVAYSLSMMIMWQVIKNYVQHFIVGGEESGKKMECSGVLKG